MQEKNPRIAAATAVLDTNLGLSRVLGNHALYTDLLKRYRQRQGDAVLRIRSWLAAGDRLAALLVAHTLKGVSGSIGAGVVSTVAGELEDGIKSGLAGKDLARILEAMDESLARTLDLIQDFLTNQAAPPGIQAVSHPASRGTEDLRTTLARLRSYAEASDVQACEYFAESRELFTLSLGPLVLGKLTAALHDFDFEVATEILAGLDTDLDASIYGDGRK
jgi:two-component system sensor histidine kinase/response regulator